MIKTLPCDGSGEHVALDEYLEINGIERIPIPAYSSEQSGLDERANRTLVESVRSMLFHAGMPKAFWGEAMAHARISEIDFFVPQMGRRHPTRL